MAAAKKTTTKKKTTATKPKVDPKVKALLAELKPLEEEMDFDYPAKPTVANLTALLKEVKEAMEDDSEEEEVTEDEESDDESEEDSEEEGLDEEDEEDESDEDEGSDEDEADSEDEDEDYDGDPDVDRPTNLSKEDRERVDDETPEIKGKSVEVMENNEHIRTYSEDLHGDDFKEKAEGFVEKRNDINKEKDNGRKCKLVATKEITRLFVKYRRETGSGDSRRVEMQKVEFSKATEGPKFKELAHALAVKVANTPSQDGPGVVVVK